jgi:hypothetical protein
MQSQNDTLSQVSRNSHSKQRVKDLKSEITRVEMQAALDQWASNLVAISRAKRSGEDYKTLAKTCILETYNYEDGSVLFKPTLASEKTFRTTFEGAHSYFVGDNPNFPEDRGFALNPWEKVDFEIAGIIIGENHGIVMGNKILTDINGRVTIANFTMGFVRVNDSKLKINLHHSSLPFNPN